MPPNSLIDQLKRDEGFRATAYKDSRGILTIGYGFNIETGVLPEDVADYWLAVKAGAVQRALSTLLPWTDKLDVVRRGVLQNMAYNLGVNGLMQFKLLLAYAQKGDWATAAAQMQTSEWYKQVGARADRLVQQMITGEWQ